MDTQRTPAGKTLFGNTSITMFPIHTYSTWWLTWRSLGRNTPRI